MAKGTGAGKATYTSTVSPDAEAVMPYAHPVKEASAQEIGAHAKVDYSSTGSPPNVDPGKEFTSRQKQKALELNKAASGGLVKSAASGTVLVKPQKSQRGVTPDPNESQFDHIITKNFDGTNCSSSLQILSRQANRAKSDK